MRKDWTQFILSDNVLHTLVPITTLNVAKWAAKIIPFFSGCLVSSCLLTLQVAWTIPLFGCSLLNQTGRLLTTLSFRRTGLSKFKGRQAGLYCYFINEPVLLSEWTLLKSLQITNAGEGVEKREHSYTVGGNINWCSPYGEQSGGSLRN